MNAILPFTSIAKFRSIGSSVRNSEESVIDTVDCHSSNNGPCTIASIASSRRWYRWFGDGIFNGDAFHVSD